MTHCPFVHVFHELKLKGQCDVLKALQLFVGYEIIVHVTLRIFLLILNKQTNQIHDMIIT